MSFQVGVSGLNAAGRNLDVIGNNVANASTVGAKSSRAEFSDVYARAAGGGSNNIGLGATLSAVTQQFSEGSISATNNAMDVAINGGGFFQVKDVNGLVTYTRNGQFQVDSAGFITNSAGLRLLGYPANSQGALIPGQAQPLTLPTAGIAPSTTANVKLQLNLNATAAVTDTGATPAIDFSDANTYNSATSVNSYDVKGQELAMTYYFQKSAQDTWNVYASANGTAVNLDGAGNPQPITQLTFPADGSAPTLPAGLVTLDVPATTGANGAVTTPIIGVKLDLRSTTQYGAAFGVTNVSQDGFPPGQLSSIAIQSTGVVLATYSSGQSAPIGQIEMATFRNMQGLLPLGANTWGATFKSGVPITGTPGSGNLGSLQAGSIEESNVDLTSELVNMMVAQRIYQANAQTIKTQDGIMQTLVSMR